MKHFNLIKSLTNLVNNRKGLFILSLALTTFGVGNVWGADAIYTLNAGVKDGKGGTISGGIYNNVSDKKPEVSFENISDESKTISTKAGTGLFDAKRKVKISATEKSGYTFGGWYNSTYTTQVSIEISLENVPEKKQNTTWNYYAKFTPNTYTITFDKQNGTGGLNSVTATYDADMPTATAPTRTGYDFAGYYDATSGGTQYYTASMASAKTWDKTSATTLYARWTAHKYTIAFNGNGATSGSMSNQPYTYDVDQNLSANNFSRNYTITYDANGGTCGVASASKAASFLGWATTPTGGKEYGDKQLIHNLTSTNNQTINLYAVWGDATTSAILPTATKDNSVIEGWYDGDDFVGEPGESYTPKQNVTLIAHWINKYDIVVTGSDQCMKVDGIQDNAFTFVHAENPTQKITIVSIDPINNGDGQVIEYDAANNKIIAHNAGTATICFEQAGTSTMNEGKSATFTYTVSKIANTLSVADASHTMYVDDNWEDKVSTNSDAIITTTTSDATIAYYDVASNKIFAQNTNNQSFNSKEVTITISQAATYKYTAAEKTIKVTVNKHVPTFTWSNATLYHNQSYNDFFTTNGTNALTVKSSSDDNVAYLVDGANAQKLNLKTLTKAASTTLTVTQAENYYWAEHTETKTITPKTVANHVPFTVTKEMYDALNDGTSGAQSWDGGIRLGDLSGGFNYDDKYREFGPFNGIPDKLSCSYSCSDAATGKDWRIYQSADGSNWGSAIISTNKAGSANNIQLAPTTRYLKFVYAGNFAGYFQNITVTELKTFSTDKSEIDFGSTNKKDMPCDPKTFTFNYANVGHKVTLSTNDNHFSVSPTSITNIGGEKYGSQTITVSYRTDEVHSATNAKLTIKDELGNTKEVTLKGTTTKKAQTLTWEKPYDVAEPAIPIGKTITGAATSSAISLDITYESSDETIIEIVNDGKAFKAIAEGTATITAKQVGTDDWEQASISKVFKTTNKIIQVISWNQNFTRLLTTYDAQDLTARVNLEDAQTGVQTWSKERSDLITYTSQNSSVVSVYGSKLNIIGKGSTTLTASVPGDDLYESATVTIPVTVRDPSAGCEDVLLTTDLSNSEYEFHRDLDTKEITKIVQIDRTSTAYPGAVTFQHRGKKSWGFYDGEIEVYESVDGGANYNTLVGHVKPNESSEYGISTFSINRNTTHLKFYRPSGSTGYHYIKNVEVIPAQFIESNAVDNTIDFGNVTVNSMEERPVTLSYANVKDNLTITKSSDDLTLSCGDIIDLDCGATGTNTITISFTPTSVGDFSDDITFFDKNSKQNYTLNIKAKVVKSTQHITWEPTQTEYRTIDQIVLNAIASSTYPVKYYVKEGTDVADFVNGVLTIKKDGQITIRAYEPGDAIYEAAVDVDKTFTIRKTNLHYDPLPTAATITYPQTLNESALTDGVVKDEDGNVVAGTITWTNPTAQLNAGDNQEQSINFTPANNPAWYNTLSSTTTVTVQKAEAIATPSASNITYGQKVNESVLTNEGTSGTWTWTDSRKEDVLNVGTYDDLAVHFTPSSNNYNELDATVSLTVTKADAQLSWTTAPANVEISETVTYVATSNHSESAITYSIIAGDEYATIDASTGVLNMLKAGIITVQANQEATTNYNAATITITTTITGQLENKFTNAAEDNDWDNPDNWTNGVPSETNPDVIIAGEVTIDEPISVGGLTIEENGKVTVIEEGSLSVNGTSADRDTYGNLFIKNGGDVTIATSGDVRVHDFVIESSIGTNGVSESGQITNANRVIYVNGAYIDINLDPSGKADDKQWYGFTVPFPVDVHNGVARKEGDTFRKLTYGTDYMFAEYDMNQRLNSGKGWKYITTSQLQPGRFYYITFNGDYNTYSFKAATNTITTSYTTDLTTNGTGANANWNAVGNSALRHVTASYGTTDDEKFVQVYQNGLSQYMTVRTNDATFVVGCPFFVQAQEYSVLQLTDAATDYANNTYAPLRNATKANRSIKLVIAPENGGYSDQVYMRTTTDVKSEYIIGRDLAKAGVGTASVQMWVNAYGQKLSVNETEIISEEAIFPLGIYAPKAGGYRLTIDETDTPTYLMENGVVIWDFANGSYVVDLSKGTNNDYSIVRTAPNAPGEATDIYSAQQNNQSINKVIFRNKMYIINNAHTYDAQGQTIR